MEPKTLRERIEEFYSLVPEELDRQVAMRTFNEFKFFLNNGSVRAARPAEVAESPTGWMVEEWVKQGILLGFRLGELVEYSINEHFRFFDKDTYPLKALTGENQVRLVPGGTSVRDGAFVAPGVIIMPPAYVNVGAYVDEGTLIDSHALVGSCAQIGKSVHLSAAAQVGGVLEPVGASPVVIEDHVFIGGNCGVYEGTVVKKWAVLAAGVILTGSTPVFDRPRNAVYRRSGSIPLVIPERAVVIPGSRPIDHPLAKEHGLMMHSPVIIKYRDVNTDAATVLESSLR
jgi:2,3,4,5-tetrahydropyridine-2-carboxylate N-succinyltransferase